MGVVVAMLRGVNLMRTRRMKMETLRTVCTGLGCSDVATYVQSGNVVLRTKERSLSKLGARLETAIQAEFGYAAPVALRTAEDLRRLVAGTPYVEQAENEPAKLLVTFLFSDPGEAKRVAARAIPVTPELVHFAGSEVLTYYPAGQGQSKLRWGPIEKALGVSGTARNWNTVLKLLEMAEELEG